MKIGIFGGTFDPPHQTHVEMAQQALSRLALDKLLIFPCGNAPHKQVATDKNIRLALTQAAFTDSRFEIEEFEISREQPAYSLDTVSYVAAKYPGAEIYFIVGGDSLAAIGTWHCPEQLAKLCKLAVFSRGGSQLHKDVAMSLGFAVVDLGSLSTDFSSTEIRLRYQFGMEITGVAPSIDSLVRSYGLYRNFAYITSRLPDYLTPKRLSHTFYVVKAGLLLRMCDPDKVFIACALHDVAKYIPQEDRKKYGFVAEEGMPETVLHAFLGAEVARRDFHVTDPEILDAIRYHTTARRNMTLLDAVVYVADKTEQSRSYPTEHLIKPTFFGTFYATLCEAYQVCLNKGDVYYLTKEAVDFYTEKYQKGDYTL